MQTCWRQGIPKGKRSLLPWACVARKRRCFNSPIGTLRNYDGNDKENIKKAIGLMSKTTTLQVHHAFLYISLLSLHNYDVK